VKRFLDYINKLEFDSSLKIKHDMQFCEFLEDMVSKYCEENLPLIKYEKKDIRFRFVWPHSSSTYYIVEHTFTTKFWAKIAQNYPDKVI